MSFNSANNVTHDTFERAMSASPFVLPLPLSAAHQLPPEAILHPQPNQMFAPPYTTHGARTAKPVSRRRGPTRAPSEADEFTPLRGEFTPALTHSSTTTSGTGAAGGNDRRRPRRQAAQQAAREMEATILEDTRIFTSEYSHDRLGAAVDRAEPRPDSPFHIVDFGAMRAMVPLFARCLRDDVLQEICIYLDHDFVRTEPELPPVRVVWKFPGEPAHNGEDYHVQRQQWLLSEAGKQAAQNCDVRSMKPALRCCLCGTECLSMRDSHVSSLLCTAKAGLSISEAVRSLVQDRLNAYKTMAAEAVQSVTSRTREERAPLVRALPPPAPRIVSGTQIIHTTTTVAAKHHAEPPAQAPGSDSLPAATPAGGFTEVRPLGESYSPNMQLNMSPRFILPMAPVSPYTGPTALAGIRGEDAYLNNADR